MIGVDATTGEPLYHCTACGDTGFMRGEHAPQALECPGNGRCGIGRCGKPGGMSYTHTYTRRCFCRATNPVLADERVRLAERLERLTADKAGRH